MSKTLKIGVFDSGLGGLIITHSLVQALPQYDYIYLGDTARVPYGNRSPEIVYDFTLQAVKYLFEQNCGLIIIACNTASSEALRRIQQQYLPRHHPDRRVLGVLIPAAEAAADATRNRHIGLLGTRGTVSAGAFAAEIHKLAPDSQLTAQAAPLLVPLVENDGRRWVKPILESYLAPLNGADTVVLGCTHYPYFKAETRAELGPNVTVISQDEIVPAKLADYLQRHPEIEAQLSQEGTRRYQVTDLTPDAERLATELFSQPVKLEQTSLS